MKRLLGCGFIRLRHSYMKPLYYKAISVQLLQALQFPV